MLISVTVLLLLVLFAFSLIYVLIKEITKELVFPYFLAPDPVVAVACSLLSQSKFLN